MKIDDSRDVQLKQQILDREFMRLFEIYRDRPENILDEALSGREKTTESVMKLWGFVVKNFTSQIRDRYWEACREFLVTTGLNSKQLEKIRNPFPEDSGSILDEMRERKS